MMRRTDAHFGNQARCFNATPPEINLSCNLSSGGYPLGGTQVEEQRLIIQAVDHEPRTRLLLDRIGIEPGWSVIDVGCGPLGILHLLSERVGPHGRVVGLEREARFAATARAEIAKRGLTNVTVVEGDVTAIKLEKESFDLVHERLVAINVSARDTLVAQMLSLLRPGGTAVLQEVDNISWICQPAHPSWDTILAAFHTVFRKGGGDPFVGRRLAELLRGVGTRDIEVATHVDFVMPGEYRRTHLVSLLDSVRDQVLSTGLLTDEELKRHRQALVAHLNDPTTTVIDKLLVQAWGRKPPGGCALRAAAVPP
jgi:ubiquinone/menaquinone biosynthesis C-methylase UbiE